MKKTVLREYLKNRQAKPVEEEVKEVKPKKPKKGDK
jgi:hypothetical protein